MPVRRLAAPALLLAVAVAISFARTALGDYELAPNENNPAPMIDAIARWDWARAAETIPTMGLTSIVLRVPAAIVAGGDLVWTYRLGALLCLLPLVALATRIDRRLEADGCNAASRAATGLLLMAGPGVVFALDLGHPEEVLGGTLCVLAVLAATDRRPMLAAVLLGLAIGTKQWAILAAFPVLLAVDAEVTRPFTRRRATAAIVGGLVAVACIAPVIALSPDRYRENGRGLASGERTRPQALLWPVSPATTRDVDLGGGEVQSLTTWSMPLGITRAEATASAVLVGLLMVPLILLAGGLRDPLALLTGLLALRCLVETANNDYYLAPALTAVVVWEATRRRPGRLPVASILAALGALVTWRLVTDLSPPVQWAVWMAATVPLVLVAALTVRRRSAPGSSSAATV